MRNSDPWRSVLVSAFAVPLFLAAPGTGRAEDRALCRQAFLQVTSPDPVSSHVCKEVASQVMAAWRFDLEQMQWPDVSEMETPLTLQLLSVERMKTEHAGLLGFARGRDLFVVSERVLDDPFANGTLAHELAHIQARRALGTPTEAPRIPRYFLEGHGNFLGRSYRDHLGISKRDYDASMARAIASFTPKETRAILTDDDWAGKDPKRIGRMEAAGIFFVEYLRVRHRGGVPDVLRRMGHVFGDVGRGTTFEHAFEHQFQASVDRVVADVVALVEHTASHPEARLRGTRYGSFLAPRKGDR